MVDLGGRNSEFQLVDDGCDLIQAENFDLSDGVIKVYDGDNGFSAMVASSMALR